MSHCRLRRAWRLLSPMLAALAATVATATAPAAASATEEPEWTTYHRDLGRSGADTEAAEPVAPTLDWQAQLKGGTWGEPLVLGERVYVATAGNHIYALEASTGRVVWEKSPGEAVPSEALPCGDIEPTVGFVGTPVIDKTTDTIYAVADVWNQAKHEAHHTLEGYRLSDGEQVLSTPVDPPGAEPKALLQRTALTLDAGQVVFGMGGNSGDCGVYKGTLVAAPEAGGAARFWQYHPEAPAYGGGAIWGASGPVVDGEDIYLATGNPNFPGGSEVTKFDYSDAFLRFDLADLVANPATETEPAPLGWFESPSWQANSNSDGDLGSAGPELLPGGLLFQAGKGATGYLLEAAIGAGGSAIYEAPVCGGAMSFGGDAYADGVIYVGCENGVQALSYDQAKRSFSPLWQGPAEAFGAPIVAAGEVWTVATGGFNGGGTTLYGLNPASGGARYTLTLPSGVTDHFASPSAAGGRLFVADGASVVAYRIAEPPKPVVPGEEPPKGTGPAGSTHPGGSGPVGASGGPPAAARLLHSRLRADRRGRVRLVLYCTTAATACRGTVTLRAEITVAGARVRSGHRNVVAVTLARVRFGPDRGAFAVLARIGRAGLAHLRRHHGRLSLQVVIACAGGRTRHAVAVLT